LAVVRELVTILGTEFNDKGLKDYEHGIARVKEIALGAAAAIGIAFSVEKIAEFIDGLIESGGEINKIRAQLTNIARGPMDDVNEAMERTFDIAQKTGAEYTKVADTYRDFLQSSKDSNISQEALLGTTENLYKAIRADRLDPAQQEHLFSIIQRADVMGKVSPRMIGMLQNTSISSLNLLSQYYGKNEEELRAFAKSGKFTFEELTKALSATNEDLNKKVGAMGYSLGKGFEYARNEMVYAAAEFLRITRFSFILGNAIVWLTDKFVAMFKMLLNALGGVKSALELLGITMAIVLGPRMLAYLIDMVGWMWRLAAANWSAVLPWTAMALAIAAVAIQIQDLVYWFQGKKSFIGTWVGSFKDLKSNFGKLDIFAGFRLPGDMIRGDWSAALKDFHILIESTPAKILLLVPAITAVTAAFVLWGLGGPVAAAIRGLSRTIRGVKTEVEGVGEAAEKVGGKGKGGPRVTKAPGQGELALLGGGAREVTTFGGAGGEGGLGLGVAWDYIQKEKARRPGIQAAEDKAAADFNTWVNAQVAKLSYLKSGTGKLGEYLWPDKKPSTMLREKFGPPEAYGPPGPGPSYGGAFVDSKTGLFGTPHGGGLGISPPAAALGPPGKSVQNTNNDNKTITFNQSNSVNVQVQDDAGLASRIATSISNYAGEMFSGIARDLGRSSPRTEAATQ
jgi:hypothetical protein